MDLREELTQQILESGLTWEDAGKADMRLLQQAQADAALACFEKWLRGKHDGKVHRVNGSNSLMWPKPSELADELAALRQEGAKP